MDEILDVLLDALIDSAKLIPLLLAVYFLIEFLEVKGVTRFENSRLLKGNLSPVFGALFGCVPQCGFSVISTDLYSAKKISVGALIAVYIATSDEALPIMLSSINKIPALLLLIAVKVILGIAVGYLSMALYPVIFGRSAVVASQIKFGEKKVKTVQDPSAPVSGCCNHEITTRKFSVKHPILHTLKIFAFVLVINLIMGFIVYFVGENNISNFLMSSYWLQPLLACLVGFIPNCASSVILTNLYLQNALTFGSIIAGLSVNAGIGFTVLFRKNRPMKENVYIVVLTGVCSLIAGYGLNALALLF